MDKETAERIVHAVLLTYGLPTRGCPSGSEKTNQQFEVAVDKVRGLIKEPA